MVRGVEVPREVRRGFWLALRAGRGMNLAASVAGVSAPIARQWLSRLVG